MFLLFCFVLLPIIANSSCSPYNFPCGNYTLLIRPPFFSELNPNCKSLHLIKCMNLVPFIQLHGQSFFYPVSNISYPDRTLIIHDLKLSFFFRVSNCVFLYDFKSPIPKFNVSSFTESVNTNSTLLDCDGMKRCDLPSNGLFRDEAYDLYYGNDLEGSRESGYCGSSRDLWFDLMLSFEGKDDFFSLLSVGFSRNWTGFPDCFDCSIKAGNCSSKHCPGLKSSVDGTRNKKIIIGGVCALGVAILSCSLCFFCYRWRLKKKLQFYEKDMESGVFHCHTHLYSYKELEEATNSFDASRELGDGGYGTVYKGVLKDGRVVAVKRLYETNYKRLEQFTNEVKILSCLRHPNLVTLYGSTSPNSPHLLLVYEFIPNGTLADHIHSPLLSKTLTLPLRLSIAMDAASALSYLHSMDIIHRDVKTHNILLDGSFSAKVADFGLSRLFPANVSHVSTAPQGTPGYLDPEYHRFYQLTDKSDVYSFGVVLMELISSRPAVDIGRGPDEISLAMAAVSKIQKGELDQLVDSGLGFDLDEEANRIITQMAELGFRCLQVDREMRPCIKEVLEELRVIEKSTVKPESSSPRSVMSDWVSRSTTTNASEQGGVSALGVAILSCSLCFFCYRWRSKKKLQFYEKDMESGVFHCHTHLFSYKELEEATNSFDTSRELGDGGYGTVYKGVLKDGRVVAVKRLYETNYKRLEQFTNEVKILSCLRHPNLVTLYGSTSPNSPHLLLVYEFIPNGTLADHIHSPLLSKTLTLPLRLSIAVDAASALSYLHSMDIIHRDVKTHNILLDGSFSAKVADFGLSRLFPANVSHVSTAPQGTPGYLDPEYHRFYQLTDKSDVYSFGVVLMELISSRPAVDIGRGPDEISLAMAAVSKIQKGELDQLVDSGLGFNLDEEANRILTQTAELGFRCLQVDREMRPCIKEVLEELRAIEKSTVKPESSSPRSVMSDWVSRSTTTNASEQGII